MVPLWKNPSCFLKSKVPAFRPDNDPPPTMSLWWPPHASSQTPDTGNIRKRGMMMYFSTTVVVCCRNCHGEKMSRFPHLPGPWRDSLPLETPEQVWGSWLGTTRLQWKKTTPGGFFRWALYPMWVCPVCVVALSKLSQPHSGFSTPQFAWKHLCAVFVSCCFHCVCTCVYRHVGNTVW